MARLILVYFVATTITTGKGSIIATITIFVATSAYCRIVTFDVFAAFIAFDVIFRVTTITIAIIIVVLLPTDIVAATITNEAIIRIGIE